MKKVQLSPVTSMLMSLSLVVGILVAGLTNNSALAAGKSPGGATSIAAQNGTLSGGLITARGVVINGVVTDGVFAGRVGIGNSLVESGCGISRAGGGVYILGVFPNPTLGDPSVTGAFPAPAPNDGSQTGDPSVTGAFPAPAPTTGDPSVTGAFPAPAPELEGAFPSPYSSTFVGNNIQVFGGTLEGTEVSVTDGLITGKNLRVVGAYVTASCSR